MATEDQPDDASTSSYSESDSDTDSDSETSKRVRITVTRMSVSAGGWWLVTADNRCRAHVFNLDALGPATPLRPPVLPARDPRARVRRVRAGRHARARLRAQRARGVRRRDASVPALVHGPLPQRFTCLHDPWARPGGEGGEAQLPLRMALLCSATWLCQVDLAERTGPNRFEKRRRGKR